VKKSCPNILATFVIFKKLPKENNRTMGENSPNLVTLFVGDYFWEDAYIYFSVVSRVARFVLTQYTKTGKKIIPNDH
jgi:hypothetical protein